MKKTDSLPTKSARTEPIRYVLPLADGSVVVGSSVGVTMPVGDSTTHLRFDFWHTRIAKNGTVSEIRKTAALVDEFNEAELTKRLEKYSRLIRRITNEEPDDDEEGPQGTRERAKSRLRSR